MTPALVAPASIFNSFIQKDISSGPSTCLFTSYSPCSLDPAKGAMPLGNGSGSNHLVFSISEVVFMLVSFAIVLANLCPSVSLSRPIGLDESSSLSGSSPV